MLKQVAGEQDKNRQKNLEELINRAGIPRRFKNRTFLSFRAETQQKQQALSICKQYANQFEKMRAGGICLVLTGLPGTGKTHLACSILNKILNDGKSGLFMTVAELLRSIRSTYSPASKQTEQQVYNHLLTADLLVLDEVGIAIGKAEVQEAMIFDVINGRYSDGLPTVLLSNLDPEQMAKFLGERVWDRIKEGDAPVISFGWESYRTKKVTAQ